MLYHQIGLYSDIIHWFEHHQGACFYRKYLGISCPGCGMQTALINLLKGNIIDSIKAYPAFIPMIILVVFLLLHIIFRFRYGAFIIKYLFIFTVILIVGNYIIHL